MRANVAAVVAVLVVVATFGAPAVAAADLVDRDRGSGPPGAGVADGTDDRPAIDGAGTTVAVAQSDDDTPENGTSNRTGNATAPGRRLAGVVGVQAAEVRGEVDGRTFGRRVAAAASNDTRAAVVAGQVDDLRDRLGNLTVERAALREAYRDGRIGRGEYRARLATLTARVRTVQRLLNATAEVTGSLPAGVLAAHGVDAAAIDRLRGNASGLSGREAAAIARSIAGPGVGGSIGASPTPGPPRDGGMVGTPNGSTGSGDDGSDAGARVERATKRVENARGDVDRARDLVGEGTGPAAEHLAAANGSLARAESALADARAALESGNETLALTRAAAAIAAADRASTEASRARRAADEQDGPGAGTGNGTDAGYREL